MLLHAFVFLSNHYHMLLTMLASGELSRFMNYVNSNLAREVGRFHDWQHHIWASRFSAIEVVDEAAMVDRQRYFFAHGCKENLVADPEQWPGVSSLPAQIHGRALQGTWFDRTAEGRARRRGKNPEPRAFATVYDVPLAPLPCWAHLSAQQQRRRYKDLLAAVRAEARANRQQSGRAPLGVQKVLQQHPHSRPLTTKRSPAPLCHASTREARLKYRHTYRELVVNYRRASHRFRQGDTTVQFPLHCFPPPGCIQLPS